MVFNLNFEQVSCFSVSGFFTLLVSITLKKLYEMYKLWSSSLCNFLHSSSLRTTILLNILFPNTQNSCCSLQVRDHVMHSLTRIQAGQPGFDSQKGQEFFSPYHCIQTSSRACPTSYPTVTSIFFPGAKQPRHEADHSSPPSTMVKDMWGYTSTPQYNFITWCLIKQWIQLCIAVLI